jgi:isoquinoline 1-oxidoreductase alpha subunit
MTALRINGNAHTVDADPNIPLLWVVRDIVGLMGTKYGCGIGECGACMVHVNGEARPSCKVTLGDAAGKDITTIEGLPETHPVLRAWAQLAVPQCGYCQAGQIMQAVAFLRQKPDAEDEEITKAMSAVLCRCGAYSRILAAVRLVARGGK